MEESNDGRDSLWILWTLTLVLNFIAFFYIGLRVRQRRWICWGCIYLFLNLLFLITSLTYDGGEMTAVRGTTMALALFSWPMCILHAIAARRDYLSVLRLMEETYPSIRPIPPSQLKWSDPMPPRAKKNATADGTSASLPIDINTCTEEEFASLPGIGVVRAKKAVSIRSQKGRFDSMDDFLVSLKVEPHFAAQIGKMAIVSGPAPVTGPVSSRRRVDI